MTSPSDSVLPRRVAVALVMAHVALLVWAIRANFVVVDEVGHLGAGLCHWGTADFVPYRVNPPLPRMLATLPLFAAGVRTVDLGWPDVPGVRREWGLGRVLARQYGRRYFALACVARLAGVAWSLLGALLVYRWSGELYGPWAGCLSLTLWCFEPSILAFAGLTVPDLPAAVAGLAASCIFWHYLRAPSWSGAWFAGLLLGVAVLTKFTWLVLYGLWPILWLAASGLAGRAKPASRPDVLQGLLLLATSLFVVNLGYAFDQSCRPLAEFEFISTALAGPCASPTEGIRKPTGNRFRDTWVGSWKVPVPAQMLRGIDIQWHEFESGYRSYLRGQWRKEGWWYYYLYALGVKVPLGTILLLVGGLVCSVVFPGRRADVLASACLLAPAAAVLLLVSSQTGMNHHARYVLPALPFLMVLAGLLARVDGVPVRGRFLRWPILAACLLWSVVGTGSVAPHFLSHFNELGGGPENGHNHLVDSNIDWGQDLLALQDWVQAHPEAQPLGCACYHFLDPVLLGIEFKLPPREPAPGWYAVSVHFVRGGSFYAPDGRWGVVSVRPGDYSWFQRFRPTGKAGYSIFLYHISVTEANAVRRDLGLPQWEEAAQRP